MHSANTIDHDGPAIVGAGLVCAIGSHAPTVLTSIAAGLSRIRSVDQPDVRAMPIVVGLARDQEPFGKHHVLSLLTRAIGGLVGDGAPDGVRRLNVLIGWPDPERPGAPAPPNVTALADCIGSRLGASLEPDRVHLITGASAGAHALVAARERLSADADLDACLVAAADSWLTTKAMRWAATRRPLRRSVQGEGMVPAEAGAALWLCRRGTSTSARLVGAACARAEARAHALDLVVSGALGRAMRQSCDIEHLVLDTDSERDTIVATSAMARGSGPRPWRGTRWFPAESIGNVGAAAGLVEVMLAAHVLTHHGEGGTALCICCADTDKPVALAVAAPTNPGASLEEPISWAL